VLIINKAPVTNKTTDKINVVIPGMIHTTKYDTTSTRSNIPVTHESSWTGSKIVIPNVSKSSEFSSTRSKISFAHEEAGSRTPVTSRTTCKVNEVTHTTKSKIPEMIHTGTTKYAATEKHITEISSTRPKISSAHEEASTYERSVDTLSKSTEIPSTWSKISIAHEETSELSSAQPHNSIAYGSKYTGNIDKYTTTENQSSLNDKPRPKILNTHKSRDKPPTVKFKINMVLNEGMNTKYATATEQSSTHIIEDNPGNNNTSFYSQYLQTVLKITNKNNNNNNGTFNTMLPLLLYQIIPIHPFIEYLQPEPEPPPLKSYFILSYFIFIFIHWKDNKTKSGIIYIYINFIILSQQHAQFNPHPYQKLQQWNSELHQY
jgi:hypothetical protein